MTAGQIAALIAAGAFVVLVLLMAVPLIKLGRTLDEATIAIRKAHEGSAPLLDDAQVTPRRSTLTRRVPSPQRPHDHNVSVLTSPSPPLGGPLVRAAASLRPNKAIKARRGSGAYPPRRPSERRVKRLFRPGSASGGAFPPASGRAEPTRRDRANLADGLRDSAGFRRRFQTAVAGIAGGARLPRWSRRGDHLPTMREALADPAAAASAGQGPPPVGWAVS